MRARAAALGLMIVFLLLAAGSLVLHFVGSGDQLPFVLVGSMVGSAGVMQLVGALVVARWPRNPVGWLLAVAALLLALFMFSDLYGRHGLITAPGSLPAAGFVYWFSAWTFWAMFFGVVLALLLFPDGRLPSPRWRPFAWIAFAYLAFMGVVSAFSPYPDGPRAALANPFAIEALRPVSLVLWSPVGLFGQVGLWAGTAVSLAVRFRRSRGLERQQLKWVASAVVVMMVSLALLQTLPQRIAANAAWLELLLVLLLYLPLPLALGIALLRYRLYDIDLLIHRTLVYGATSALLAMVYAGSVLALGALARPLTGSGDLAIAGSTLAVVALFAPLRRRIQGAVDRRFYRSHYDAQRTVDRFALRLRDEVELDAVRAGLLGAVVDTVRPAHASLWVREVTR